MQRCSSSLIALSSMTCIHMDFNAHTASVLSLSIIASTMERSRSIRSEGVHAVDTVSNLYVNIYLLLLRVLSGNGSNRVARIVPDYLVLILFPYVCVSIHDIM